MTLCLLFQFNIGRVHDLPPQGLLVYEIFLFNCVERAKVYRCKTKHAEHAQVLRMSYSPSMWYKSSNIRQYKKKNPPITDSAKNFVQLMLKKPLRYRALLEGGLEGSGRTKVHASTLAVNVQSSCAGINDVTYSCINLCVCLFACSLLKHKHTCKTFTNSLHPKVKGITSGVLYISRYVRGGPI